MIGNDKKKQPLSSPGNFIISSFPIIIITIIAINRHPNSQLMFQVANQKGKRLLEETKYFPYN